MLIVVVNDRIVLTDEHLTFSAERSSGPGGQNVNKVASKVRLRFDFEPCELLTDDVKARLRSRYARRLDAEGALVVVSQVTRDQRANLLDACARLKAIVLTALRPPNVRKKTKPSRSARLRRLGDKRHQAEKKAHRCASIGD